MAAPAAPAIDPAILANNALDAQQQVELQKIPLFFGDATKDAFTVEQFVARIDRAAESVVNPWNDRRRCAVLQNAVRGDALLWIETAEMRHGRGILTNWVELKAAFIRAYSKFKTTRCQMAIFSNLQQGSGESVTKFHTRVAKAIIDVRSLDDPCPPLENPFPDEIEGLDGFDDVPDDVLNAHVQRHQDHGDIYRENRIAKHLFVAGLHAKIRDELLKGGIQDFDFNEVFEEALGMEKALSDISMTAKLHAVDAEDDDAKLARLSSEIEAIQMKKGYNRGGYRGRGGRGRGGGRGGSGNGNANPDIICFHCQKKGHIAVNCNSKKRGEKPAPRNQANVEAEEQGEQQNPFSFSQPLYEPGQAAAQLSAISADYLN